VFSTAPLHRGVTHVEHRQYKCGIGGAFHNSTKSLSVAPSLKANH
jgi:hypothetical protein